MTKSLACILGVGIILTCNSCGSKGIIVRADDYDSETIVDLMNEEEPIVSSTLNKVTPSIISKKSVDSSPLDGEWIIVGVKKKEIHQDDDMPYIIFSDSEGRFYASNGCNILNGNYSYHTDSILTFSSVISSLKTCPDITYQNEISVVLNDGVAVKTKIENKDRETYLYLYSNANDLLLTLRRHNLEVINGQWEVIDINGIEVDGEKVNLFFDIPELSIHGNTGCNYFNGAIMIDPDVASAISFSEMGVTMRHCENAEIERNLLVALEQTETYTLKDKNTLSLNDSNGKALINLKRQIK